jgi:tetratricopeptide (TPR) repeat protein
MAAVGVMLLAGLSAHAATNREEGERMLKEGFDTMSLPTLEDALRVWRVEAAGPDHDGEGHYHLARALEALAIYHGNRDEQSEAVAYLQDGVTAVSVAIERSPSSSPYHTTLGELYGQLAAFSGVIGKMRFGRLAAGAYARALELDPRNALAYVGAGIGKLETPAMFGGSPDEAIRAFHRARELDPDCDEAWIWEGIARRRQGAVADARAAFNHALRINPRSDHAKRELARLDEDF